jgi:hypothetical protein
MCESVSKSTPLQKTLGVLFIIMQVSGLNGLDPDLDRNKHRMNLDKVRIELILLGMAGHAK